MYAIIDPDGLYVGRNTWTDLDNALRFPSVEAAEALIDEMWTYNLEVVKVSEDSK